VVRSSGARRTRTPAPAVPAEILVEALLSSDCAGVLAGFDPRWVHDTCADEGELAATGCAAAPAGGEPTTLGILLALAAALATRRWAAQKRTTPRAFAPDARSSKARFTSSSE
jgi:hypothetical protein